MRWIYASLAIGLFLLPLSQSLFLPRRSCPKGDRTRMSVNPCQNADAEPCETVGIEDELFKNTLLRQGESLIEQGQTTETAQLVEQLQTEYCQLDLPRHASGTHDPVDLFRVAHASVVVVGGLYKCDKCTRWHSSTASGFVIAESGAIVTNYHVVDASIKRTLVVMTADRRVYPVQSVLAASRRNDLAILRVDAADLCPLPLAEDSSVAPVGSAVSVISHPDGRYYSYTTGIVSRYMRNRSRDGLVDIVAITADYARGSSGAPVLNSQGQVVAVVSSTESIYYSDKGERQENLQMVFKNCIPVSSLQRLIRPERQLVVKAAR